MLCGLAAVGAGRETIRLTRDDYDDTVPAFAPDGKHIAFVSDRNGTYCLAVMRTEAGGKQRVLVRDAAADSSFAWRPDSDALAYTRQGAQGAEVCEVGVTSGAVRVIGPGRFPAYRPDGSGLVLARDDDLWWVDTASGTTTNLTRHGRPTVLQGAAWSPDGKQVYYACNNDLWCAFPHDTRRPIRQVDHTQDSVTAPFVAHPFVGPSGRYVFYDLITEGLYGGVSNNRVGRYDTQTAATEAICDANGWTISPDDCLLVYVLGTSLYRRDLSSGGADKLFSGSHPAWGPQGRLLVYCDRNGLFAPADIYMVSLSAATEEQAGLQMGSSAETMSSQKPGASAESVGGASSIP